MALTAEKIIADFGLTKEGFGRVIAAFRTSYGICQILGGFLVDAHGPMIVFPAASGLWALSGLLTGLAATVGMLTGCRFLLGIGEAFNWPCALKVTQELVPPQGPAVGERHLQLRRPHRRPAGSHHCDRHHDLSSVGAPPS